MRLIRSTMDAVSHVLCEAWSTHLFTFATSDSIYCLYPVISLRKRQMVLTDLFSYHHVMEYDACVRSGMKRVRLDDILCVRSSSLGGILWIPRCFVCGSQAALKAASTLKVSVFVLAKRERLCHVLSWLRVGLDMKRQISVMIRRVRALSPRQGLQYMSVVTDGS